MVLENFLIDVDVLWDRAGKELYEKPQARAGRKMRVRVTNKGLVEDLTGYTLNLGWKSTIDETKFGLDAFTAVDITKGIFEIAYTSGMLTNIGTLVGTLQLVPSVGDATESNNFMITVKKSAVDAEAMQSETSFTALVNALVSVNDWNARIDAVEADFIQRANDMEATYPQEIISLGQQLEQAYIDFQTAAANLTIDSEVILARNSAIKNKTALSLDGRLEEMETDTAEINKDRQSLTNLLPNGDFSDGTTGVTAINSTISALNGVLTITGTGANTTPGAYIASKLVAGHKNYVRAIMSVDSAACTSLRLQSGSGEVFAEKATPTVGKTYKLSAIGTPVANINTVFTSVFTSAAASTGAKITVKNVVAIDLTAIFGAGKEPTLAEMDDMIAELPDSFFEGKVLLPAKDYKHPHRVQLKHKVLIAGIRYMPHFHMPIADDLFRVGFLSEVCSLEAFIRSAYSWVNEFDVLVLADSNIPYYSKATTAELKAAVKLFMDAGIKVIWLQDTTYTLHFHKLGYDGQQDVSKQSFVNDLFDGITMGTANFYSVNGTMSHADVYPLTKEILVPNLIVAYDRFANFSTSSGVLLPIKVTNGTSTAYPVAIKKGKYAIISYGSTPSGDPLLISAFRYIDYANLIIELLNLGDNDRLAMDSLFGKKAAAIGIDGDNTVEIEPVKDLLETSGGRPLEVGLVSNVLTDDMFMTYRGLSQKYGNLGLCSHTKTHYAPASAITVTDELYTIDSAVINLKKPFKALITSIKSEDGLTTYALNSTALRYASPTVGQYSVTISTVDNRMADGRIKFNLADVGKKVKITYTYFDNYGETVGSINTLFDKGCADDEVVYLTLGNNSVDSVTYKIAEKQDIVLCDYFQFPSNYRAWVLAEGHYGKLPYLSGNTIMRDALNSVVPDDLIRTYTKADILTNLYPTALQWAQAHETPLITYSHDISLSKTHGNSVVVNPSIYNADFVKGTFAETRAYLMDYYTSIFNLIDTASPYWTTRGAYCRYYQYINKHLAYDIETVGDKKYLHVRNSGDKSLHGVTFKINSATEPVIVKILANEKIPYVYANGVVTLYFDISAGESLTVLIKR